MKEGFCFISVTGHNRPNIGKGMNEYGGGGGGDDNDDNQIGCLYRSLL